MQNNFEKKLNIYYLVNAKQGLLNRMKTNKYEIIEICKTLF